MKEMRKIPLTIEALSPLVLTAGSQGAILTESGDAISGAIVRGMIAARFIEAQNLGRAAHESEAFRRLFAGALKFSAAYPSKGGESAMRLPLSLQKDKLSSALADLAASDGTALKGYKPLKGCGIVRGAAIERVETAKNISLHMSRDEDGERLAGKSTEGGIYSYESLLPGQAFCGEIVGEAADIQELLTSIDCEDGAFLSQIGKSRSTQYGLCRIALNASAPLEPLAQSLLSSTLRLRLATPLLSGAAFSRNAREVLDEEFLAPLKESAESDDFSLGRIFAASASASNFVGVWNMRRPTQFGLDAGSIFELKKASPWTSRDAAALAALLAEGAGSRTEEGFGRFALWTVDAPTLFEATQERPERRPVKSERARAIVRAVLRRRIAQSVRLAAYKDASTLTGKLAGMTHAFARLEAMLGPRENLEGAPARFRAKFAAEVGAKRTPLARHLEGVKLGAAELRDILRGERPELSPYASLDLSAEVPQELAEDAGFSRPVLKDDGEIFYDYWLWFFRHARKRAVQQRKEAAD